MEIVYVLEFGDPAMPSYYCGYFVEGKPVLSGDFEDAAMFSSASVAGNVKTDLGNGFRVEEHGFFQ